ncbi:AAA family ATPase [Myxococcus sp. RHSTA-1-4]|uniref:BTAD domain-containing putative transcriptional regulator n=1 Tax=Myxococcus sp. RHSTA-1-4 TaxID=2874601 RepID=UPI001CBDE0DB|nr:AAA family ATPase [Myxococcus sp. RHSTA-1-4]MBZ4419302.1 AAA family ATPase [Myxococcus sp. RHSTA-1-4]
MTSPSLQLLGGARFHGPHGTVELEGKQAALLALLALDGPSPRGRVAGLLWGDSPESVARNNLSQTLRRIHKACGHELVVGTKQLSLDDSLRVDVRELLDPGTPPERASALALAGELLGHLRFDAENELDDWLRAERERLSLRQGPTLLREAARKEAQGDLPEALELVSRQLALNPLSEEACRRAMRLHFALGDRGAALATFERCRARLEEELGVAPVPETARLARELAQATPPPRATPARPALPLSLLHPPALVGREREWARMEEEWAAGKVLILSGPAGVGKTRLMQEFLGTHARTVFISGRPGDKLVPFATFTRTYEKLSQVLGEGSVPAWAERELARVIPGLGRPAPAVADFDKLRLFQAKVEVFRAAMAHGFGAVGYDDLQLVDGASMEAGIFILSHLQQEPGASMRAVACYRTGELPPEVLAWFDQAVAANLAAHIVLEPLATRDIEALLASLDVPGARTLAPELARGAGGNPAEALARLRGRWAEVGTTRP